ncbi:peptidoglycan-binding protein [Verrucomicrobia bacterium]|nr:peptidoglycan-binding protein [Verrucomicrobiota bacterium]
MDADMYAGSSYAPTSNAGTSSATQTFSSSATSTGSFTGAASNKSDDGPGYAQSYNPADALYSNTATAMTAAGATLKAPTQAVYNPMNLYSSQNMQEISTEINDYLRGTAIDDAMREALNLPEVYQGAQTEEEPDPIVDTDKLKDALQPEPITVEELPDVIVKAGDTLTAIAEANGVPVQDVIDANPQIANPDMIRPGEKVKLSSRFDTKGETPSKEKAAGTMNFTGGDADTSNLQFVDIEDETGAVTTSPRPQARPEGLGAPTVRSYRDPVKVSVTTDKTASNIKDIQQALTDMGYKPNGVDGKVGGGTKRALRKFQAENNLPITGELTQEVADLLTNGTSAVYPDMPVPSAPVKDFDTNDFDVFSGAVAGIESGNHGYTTYAYPTRVGNKLYKKGDLLYGGDGGHYLGRYQMGKDALADVGRKYTPTLNEAFLRDPALQDKLFKKYTMKNHKHLTINSEKYRNMTDQEKLGILGYAHNQGATAAEEYLFTGQVGADAFGTKGTKYTDTIAKALGN